ncbi:amino acid ABC transporter permease [Reyranella sp. CPCC 100927]|uniref:amino acid ABC transporter permease n=1 Tax=Reyranella sp. CPCC 100927 TaxID=2599616 RepID=UPI0011B7E222|nr:amino acid ABC transporter permease [Reyranella sp. CPCC 100927]TWT13973.1 amino acid ABC transporter permease [Reyranella sp. CPCC 100927]
MTYAWDWLIFFKPSVTGEGLYGWMLVRGLGWTLLISLLSWLFALALGTVLGTMRTLTNRWLAWPALLYVHCFRNTPLLVQLFLWFFVVPELLPPAWGTAIKQLAPTTGQFLTVVLCLSLYTAAKVAELVRAGIEALPPGQRAAGAAMGLTQVDVYRYVLLPQAFRTIVPPLTSDFMNVFKNSAVALTIGLMELTGQSRQLSEFSAQSFEAFTAATLIYMAVTYGVVLVMRHVERRARIPGMLGTASG